MREHETRDRGRQLHRRIAEERRRADELAAAGGREAVDEHWSIEIPQRVHLDLRLAAGIGGELPCDRAGRPGIGENDVELNVGGSAGGIPRQTQSAAGTPDRQRRRPVEHGGDEAGEPDAVSFAGLVLHPRDKRLTGPRGREVTLTEIEAGVLLHLAGTPGVIWPAKAIVASLEGARPSNADRAVPAIIARLRKKMGSLGGPAAQRLIKTEIGRGYVFAAEAARAEPAAFPARSG